MNTIAVTKRGPAFRLGDQLALPVAAAMSGLADGDYVLGFRAHHLYLRAPGPDAVALSARVSVAEISGSETFVHVTFAGCSWVALAHGVHEFAIGEPVELHLDPGRFFVFDRDGHLAAAPALRAAA